jgi:hypothetical protein
MRRVLACALLACALVACALGLSSSSIAADNVAAARKAEAEAREAFKKGDFEAAARAFAEAFRFEPAAATKYNEAFAWNRAEQPAAAADAYEAALELGTLEPKLERASEDRLAQLKAKLGVVVVRAPLGASVSVEHADERPIPARIHLAPGTHQLELRHADGSIVKEEVSIVAGKTQELSFPEPQSEPARRTVRAEPTPEAAEPARPQEDDHLLRIAGGVLIGAGAAALIAMGVTGALTLDKVSDYDEGLHTDADLREEAVTLKTTTNVLLGVGSGLVAVGLALVLVDTFGGDDEGPVRAEGATLRIDW